MARSTSSFASSSSSSILESAPPSPLASTTSDRPPFFPSETSPLLANVAPSVVSVQPTQTTSNSDETHWRRWKVAYIYGLFILIINFGDSLLMAPKVRLLESAICQRHYLAHDPSRVDDNGNVPETECKLNTIQSELAILRAGMSVLEGLVGVLVALPYGTMADTKGRRLGAALSMIGMTLSESWVILVCYSSSLLPPRAALASAVFQLLGGGSTVLNAVVPAALADSAPANRRTAVFFYASTSTLISELIATPLGAYIMTKTTLYAVAISAILIEFAGTFVLLAVPETLSHISAQAQNSPDETDRSASDSSSESADNSDEDATTQSDGKRSDGSTRLRDLMCMAKELTCRLIKIILHDRTIVIALPAVIASRIGSPVVSLLLQYASKNLHWSLAKASVLVSVRPAVNIVLFALVLPNLSRILASRLKVPVPKADLLVAKVSATILVFGLLVLALGKSLVVLVTGLVVYTLGWGLGDSVILYLTSCVDESEIATLLSMVSMMATIGSLATIPILAAAFSKGMELEGLGSGLPFFAALGITILTSFGLWTLRWR